MQATAEQVKAQDLAAIKTGREAVFGQLMSARGGYNNDFYLARILSSWVSGDGVLPIRLGLDGENYQSLLTRHFTMLPELSPVTDKTEFERDRLPEWEDLVQLLVEYRAEEDPSELWVAEIIAAACLGSDHLWQDLGLWCRVELSELLQLNFPSLASLNNKDMKWKKFLYKRLCERDGTYVCRAPSCNVCADYDVCFGPEE